MIFAQRAITQAGCISFTLALSVSKFRKSRSKRGKFDCCNCLQKGHTLKDCMKDWVCLHCGSRKSLIIYVVIHFNKTTRYRTLPSWIKQKIPQQIMSWYRLHRLQSGILNKCGCFIYVCLTINPCKNMQPSCKNWCGHKSLVEKSCEIKDGGQKMAQTFQGL